MKRISYLSTCVLVFFLVSCGGDDEPSDPCAVPIQVSVETTNTAEGDATGTATISATGGNGGFTYAINGGTAQSSNVFNDLAAGNYTLVVTDSEECTTTTTFNIDVALTASFAADIAPIIAQSCATTGCHVTGGNAPFTLVNYAEISARAARIKARTGARTMPPSGSGSLTQLQIDLIAAWVDAGAQNN